MMFYMHPDTARALLARSRATTTALRARRSVARRLRELGWDEQAAKELAAIDHAMKERKQ